MKKFKVIEYLGAFHTLEAARAYIGIEFRKHHICGRPKSKGKPDAFITYWRQGRWRGEGLSRRPSRVDRLYLDGRMRPLGGRFRVHGVIEVMEDDKQTGTQA